MHTMYPVDGYTQRLSVLRVCSAHTNARRERRDDKGNAYLRGVGIVKNDVLVLARANTIRPCDHSIYPINVSSIA